MKRGFNEHFDEAPQKRTRTENPPCRTLYIGSLPPQTSVADLCDLVHEGALESARLLQAKHCGFITFLDLEPAIECHRKLTEMETTMYGKRVIVGFGTSRDMPPDLVEAIAAGASRSLFIGGSVDRLSEGYLWDQMSAIGPVDCVDIIHSKKIAFVHFGSVGLVMKAKEMLSSSPQWAGFRFNFGKDRCRPDTKHKDRGGSRGQRMPPQMPPRYGPGPGPMAAGGDMPTNYPHFEPEFDAGPPPGDDRFYDGGRGPLPPMDGQYARDMDPSFAQPHGGQRTIYLGGFLQESMTVADVLSAIQGSGALDRVKVLPEKKCVFVTFVDPMVASTFYNKVMRTGLEVNGFKLKLGWGKTRPLPDQVAEGIKGGATRNLFLGGLTPDINEEKLLQDFGPHAAAIEKIDVLPAKKIAFVHFLSILAAMTAKQELTTPGASLYEGYSQYRINYGADRCAPKFRRGFKNAPPPRELLPPPQFNDMGYGAPDVY